MDRKIRPCFTSHQDQSRIGHDQRIGAHRNNRLEVTYEGSNLSVVGEHIGCEEKEFSKGMRLRDPLGEVILEEIVVAHPKAIAG